MILGLDGDDTLCGGDGRDIVNGGRGQDACSAEVVNCEQRLTWTPSFPFEFLPQMNPLVNGGVDNEVRVDFQTYGDRVSGQLWVTIAFYNGQELAGTAQGSAWTCSAWTTGLPRRATGAAVCQYSGATPRTPGPLIYELEVNLAKVPQLVLVQYCGGTSPGIFYDPSCTDPPVAMTVVAP